MNSGDVNFEFGEVPVSASVQHAQNKPVGEIVRLGHMIQLYAREGRQVLAAGGRLGDLGEPKETEGAPAELKENKEAPKEDKGGATPSAPKKPQKKKRAPKKRAPELSEEQMKLLLKHVQEKFKDFNVSWPIVLRSAVEHDTFDKDVFEKFLRYWVTHQAKDRKDFLKIQAEYLVMLSKSKTAHYDEKRMNQYRDSLVRSLHEEDEKFVAAQKEATETVQNEKQQKDRLRRAEIYLQLQGMRSATGGGKAA